MYSFILQLLRRTSRVPDTELAEDTSISEPCSTRASDVDSIVELEGTTCRLVRADDLATIDVERSLRAIVNEGNVIPRIRLSTFKSTVDLATITELDVQVVVWRRSITEAHVDLRTRSPSTKDSLVIDIEAIDISHAFRP